MCTVASCSAPTDETVIYEPPYAASLSLSLARRSAYIRRRFRGQASTGKIALTLALESNVREKLSRPTVDLRDHVNKMSRGKSLVVSLRRHRVALPGNFNTLLPSAE